MTLILPDRPLSGEGNFCLVQPIDSRMSTCPRSAARRYRSAKTANHSLSKGQLLVTVFILLQLHSGRQFRGRPGVRANRGKKRGKASHIPRVVEAGMPRPIDRSAKDEIATAAQACWIGAS